MIIRVLCENKSISDRYESEHGLSLYIEFEQHKILFDMGQSNVFYKNAKKMSIDIGSINMAFLSHGHYDHGGGLGVFLENNPQAKVYCHALAFRDVYSNRSGDNMIEIGLNKELSNDHRLILTENVSWIEDNIVLIGNVNITLPQPSGNKKLFMKVGDTYVHDDFMHEQHLLLKEGEKWVLIVGCAHNGVLNILEYIKETMNIMPSFIIGGFHLGNKQSKAVESIESINAIGKYLSESDIHCFTCHCTGDEAYELLKKHLGSNIENIHTGSAIQI